VNTIKIQLHCTPKGIAINLNATEKNVLILLPFLKRIADSEVVHGCQLGIKLVSAFFDRL
jgi:hypothetical protein